MAIDFPYGPMDNATAGELARGLAGLHREYPAHLKFLEHGLVDENALVEEARRLARDSRFSPRIRAWFAAASKTEVRP
jgi:hypothetical protein